MNVPQPSPVPSWAGPERCAAGEGHRQVGAQPGPPGGVEPHLGGGGAGVGHGDALRDGVAGGHPGRGEHRDAGVVSARTTVPVWTEVVAVVVAVNCAKTPLGSQSPAATRARTNRVRAHRPTLDCARGRKEASSTHLSHRDAAIGLSTREPAPGTDRQAGRGLEGTAGRATGRAPVFQLPAGNRTSSTVVPLRRRNLPCPLCQGEVAAHLPLGRRSPARRHLGADVAGVQPGSGGGVGAGRAGER